MAVRATDDQIVSFETIRTASRVATTEEAHVNLLIDHASHWFRNTGCKRILKSQSVGPEYYDGPGGYELILKQRPVTGVTSIYQDLDKVWGSTTEISSDDYQIDEPAGIIILKNLYFYRGRLTIKITYTAGYTTIPYDLEQAAIRLVDYWYQKDKYKRTDIKSVSHDGRTIEYINDIPADVKKIASFYSRRVVA